ncbi:hypothetical protein MF271_12035 [Deinococcus sp. KNUC1210]|uniref:hypothetical protein n=1 Tax=Deinococcus sp. KNUC1210 TaxID=2917691 RepID=UPI001EF055CB|nr:hypothetical protein [Deinococcus sp. KNUC1210]ULH14725.1 hypothetical protein MF271_12035 [Deinococcus sp. KNUC1210]
MNINDDHSSELDDSQDLDALFARAAALTPADHGAAERFLARQQTRRQHTARQWWRVGLSSALASAAAVGGLLVFWPAPGHDLPTSEAYSAYQSALGDGW